MQSVHHAADCPVGSGRSSRLLLGCETAEWQAAQVLENYSVQQAALQAKIAGLQAMPV
jgi:hypothetical protein